MVRTSKRQRNTTEPPPSPTPSITHNHYDYCGKKKPTPIDPFNQVNNDYLAEIYSNMKSDMTRIRRFASEMALHDQSDIEFKLDGSITITPHPYPQLPNKIITCIIDHLCNIDSFSLYQCGLVNKQFYTMTNPTLWRLLGDNFQIYHKSFIDWLMGASRDQVESIGEYITELNLFHSYWQDAHLIRLLPHVRHLKHLTIDKPMHITETTFQHVPFFCQHLMSLEIGCNTLTDRSFATLGQHCHQLRGLKWEIVQGQSPEWLGMLMDRCPLQHLEILSTSGVAISELTMTMMKKFNLLTHLEIWQGPLMNTRYLLLSDTTSWPHLTSLILSPCYDLDDATFLGFIKSHPHLEEITLSDTTELTDLSLDGIPESLAYLRRLTLPSSNMFSQNGLRRFLLASNNLVYFKPYSGTDASLKSFLEMEGVETKVTSLNRKIIEKIKQNHHHQETTTVLVVDQQ